MEPASKKRATRWTDEKIRALKLPSGKGERRVLVEPGLYLHIRARSGGHLGMHWQYRAQVNGVRRWLSLGAFPTIGLAKAKADLHTHEAVHEAAKKGEADHPVITARFARKAAKAQPTVSELFDDWIADKRMGSARKAGEPVRDRTVKLLTENFDADIRDRIGAAKVSKLTREALQGCIDAPRKRGAPGAAAHVYRTLRGLINFALKRGHIDGSDPMRGIENPKPYRPAQIVNAATDAELVALFKELDSSRIWPSTKLAIEFQLLTGARPGEVRLVTWKETHTDRAYWVIPADRVKSGREFKVHLSRPALSVLERAKSLAGLNAKRDGIRNDYIFPGANGGPMEKMAVARALSRLAERTKDRGGKKLRPHDLRRTFRTMLSRIGVAPHIAELCMNHQETATLKRVYDGHSFSQEVADAWDRAGAHLTTLQAGGALVIPIAKHRA